MRLETKTTYNAWGHVVSSQGRRSRGGCEKTPLSVFIGDRHRLNPSRVQSGRLPRESTLAKEGDFESVRCRGLMMARAGVVTF